ncbi:acyl-CoA thioesterase [Alkalihalobacillus sp. 1P02AB]|uniref:acyl-CoA thioesterase n=1 Tax=Alkalihalobacillus sp. 1P02AB TaxID=3132260 RepID=UPI0039A6A1FB
MRKNEIEVLVNWGDTDKAGIVYYPNYFKWFDIAGHQFFRSCGLSPTKLEKERQIILPMLDARCTFEKTLLYEDLITIRTTVIEINAKTIKLKHEVFNGDIRTGNGYELRGWVQQTPESIKAVLIPDDVKAILESDVQKGNGVLATTKYNA